MPYPSPILKPEPCNMISPEILRRYPYFAGIDDAILRQLAMIAEEKSGIPAGTRLFDEGQPVKYLGIIVSGEVNIQYLLGSGEMRTVDTLVGGDLLGFSALDRALQVHRFRHDHPEDRPGPDRCPEAPRSLQ